MAQGKLLRFTEDADMLLDMAAQYSQEGQHIKAVSLIRRILHKNPNDKDALYALADELADAEQYKASNDILFKLLAIDPNDYEVLLMLGENYYALSRWNLAGYYFKRYSELNPDGIELETSESSILTTKTKGFALIHPLTEEHAEELQYKASQLIRSGKIEQALDIFKEIEDAFPQDSDAKNNIAFAYLLKNNVQQGLQYAKAAYELDNNNIFALSNLAMAHYISGNKEECEVIAQKLNAVDTNDSADLFKIASTFCEIKKDKYAYNWLKKFIIVTENCSADILLLYAFSAFNSADYEECIRVLKQIKQYDENNTIINYYLNYVFEITSKVRHAKPKRLDYYPQIPLSELTKRVSKLRSARDFYGIWWDKKLLEEVIWALDTLDDIRLHDEIIEKLSITDHKKANPFLKKLLLNQNLSLSIKGKVLFCLLINGVRGRLYFLKEGYFTTLDIPKNIPNVIADPVLLCIAKFATLFLLEKNFITKIINTAKKIQANILQYGLEIKDDGFVLAAVIGRNCRFEGITDKKIMELFNVSYSDMVKLNDYIYNVD